MAEDTDSLVLSISADIKQVERALKKLTADSKASTDSVVRNFNAINPAVDKTAASIARVDKAMVQSSRATGFAVQNLRFQLQDLSTQILSGGSPFTAVQQQMTQMTGAVAGLSKGAALAALGRALISPWTLVPAVVGVATLAAQKYFTDVDKGSAEAAADLKKVADGWDEVAKAFPELAQAKSLATLSRAAASEADLLSKRQQLVAESLKRTDAALKPLIPDFVDMISLLQQAGDIEGAQRLTDAYNELTTAMESGVGIAEAAAKVQAALAAETIKHSEAAKNTSAALEKEKSSVAATEAELTALGISIAAVRQSQNALTDAVERAASVTAKASKSYVSLYDALKDLTTLDDQILALGLALGGLLPEGGVGALPGKLLSGGFELGGINREAVTATPSAAKTFLRSKAANARIAGRIDQLDDDMATALAKLFTVLPSGANINSAVRTFDEQAELRRKYLAGTGGLAAPPGTSRHERGAAVDIGGVSPEVLKTAVDQMTELETLKGRAYEVDKMHVQLKGTQKKAEDDLTASRQRSYETMSEALIATKQETEMMQVRATALGMSTQAFDQQTYAVEFATKQQQLLNLAKSDGTAATADEVAAINSVSDAYAKQKAMMEGAEVAAKDLEKSKRESAAAAEQFANQIGGIAQNALGGFIGDLRAGVDAGEAFNNMLNNIIDSMIDMALQAAFSADNMKSLFSGLGGLGGGPLTSLPLGVGLYEKGGLVGKSKVPHRLVDPRVFRNAPSFARGGVAGAIPALLHPGELVIPKALVGRVRGSAVGAGGDTINAPMNGNIQIDMSATGVTTANSEDARKFGEQVRAAVQVIMVAEQRPGGLLRKPGSR